MKKPSIFLMVLALFISACFPVGEWATVPRNEMYVKFRMESDRGQLCGFHPITCDNQNPCDIKADFTFKIYSIASKQLEANQRITIQALFFVQNNVSHPWICKFGKYGQSGLYTVGAIDKCVQGALIPGPVRIVMTGYVEEYSMFGLAKREAKILGESYIGLVRELSYRAPCLQ